MPNLTTEVTEIGTGLGTLPYATWEAAVANRPATLLHVTPAVWDRLEAALGDDALGRVLASSWTNGRALLHAQDGLRGRTPNRVEWKGNHKPPGYDRLPADLRIDHVYLVSCKYLSKVLWNVSPSYAIDSCLEGAGEGQQPDWYGVVAPDAYDELYAAVRSFVDGLPPRRTDLAADDRQRIKAATAGQWPEALKQPAREFSLAVARATAARWEANLPTHAARLRMLWLLLRLSSAPYFILGTTGHADLRLRVATPWDWSQAFELLAFEVGAEASQQPQVGWRALVRRRLEGDEVVVCGHLEVRWSHGRFCGSPEAKAYLDTPHGEVPGYFPLV